MKILFITSKLNFKTAGGSIEEFDVMIRNLIKLGNDVTVITAFSYMNDIPTAPPYKIIEENIVARRLLGIQNAVFNLLKKYEKQADFFHIDGHLFLYGAGLYRRLGGRVPVSAFFNRELIVFPENISTLFRLKKPGLLHSLKRKIRWCLEKYIGMPIANGIDIFLFTNPVLRQVYEKFGLRRDSNSLIIGDPLDYQKIMAANNLRPEDYLKKNKKGGPITLFYSSRMAPGKGFDLLLSAFAEIKNKENFRLILGGAGPEEKLIRKMADDLGIARQIDFPGWVSKERLYQYYKEADVFVQAHWRTDNTSVSLSYAMAFGLPSILPGGGGLEWVAKNSALYFKDGDYRDLAAKIEALGTDFGLRERLSRNCYLRLAEDEMSAEKQMIKLNRQMGRVLAGRKT